MDAKRVVSAALEKALVAQAPMAKKNVERLRRVHPQASPSALIRKLDTAYLSAVTVSGVAAGAVGIVPGAGVPTAVADVLVFTEATVLYVLSRAEVHGLHPEDVERRKLLAYMVLVGDSANTALGKAIPRTGGYWAKRIVEGIPMSAVNAANKVLGPRFITKYGTKQGVLVLSKQVPLGLGAVLGGGGNHVFGRLSVRAANKVFGPPPEEWPGRTDGTAAMNHQIEGHL
ncbi:MAG: hypothetical protein LCH98_19435 [Actinobacteria bacterium]|nr:hypothetical protein [Actinomycetota bacterium]